MDLTHGSVGSGLGKYLLQELLEASKYIGGGPELYYRHRAINFNFTFENQ